MRMVVLFVAYGPNERSLLLPTCKSGSAQKNQAEAFVETVSVTPCVSCEAKERSALRIWIPHVCPENFFAWRKQATTQRCLSASLAHSNRSFSLVLENDQPRLSNRKG